MISLNTNVTALYAQQALSQSARSLTILEQQLATGKRIASAGEDPAGVAIGSRLTSQINGLRQAVRNANDAISLVQTADTAADNILTLLQRMRELALASASSTIDASNYPANYDPRISLNAAFMDYKAEIDRWARSARWSGSDLLNGIGGTNQDGVFNFQIGANSNETATVQLPDLQTGPQDTYSTQLSHSVDGAGVLSLVFSGNGGVDDQVSINTNNGGPGAGGYLGVIFQATIGKRKVQYQVTQADVNATDSGGALLSNRILAGLKLAAEKELGSTYTIDDNMPGALMITTPSNNRLDSLNTGLEVVTGGLKGVGGYDVNILLQSGAQAAIDSIDAAMQVLMNARSTMGAMINRLQFASDGLSQAGVTATEARSRIEDTDYALATTEFAKRNILQQAAQSMLAQANVSSQMVLQLLKGL